jgi:glycosyltransferase involved in cell wall biosynthesis
MISIVMSYYNRMPQLRYTLRTIDHSLFKDVEIVIVDDFSDPAQHLNLLPEEFPKLNFKLIDMRARYGTKAWCNPCVPYNEGLRASSGDMIIIQNPECCHMGDVLSYVNTHLKDGTYLSFHTYACTKEDVKVLHATDQCPMFSHSKKARWYNHETERPVAFHFCNAITRKDLIQVNGFDERFAQGYNWDDVELLHRIKKICQVKFVANPWAVHQYHAKSYGHPDNPAPLYNNKELYLTTTEQEAIVRAPNKESIV